MTTYAAHSDCEFFVHICAGLIVISVDLNLSLWTIKASWEETYFCLGLAVTPPWFLAWLELFRETLSVETLCVTLCPANTHKSVVSSPTATSSNDSWTFTGNHYGCLAPSLVRHQTSQCFPVSYWRTPPPLMCAYTHTNTHPVLFRSDSRETLRVRLVCFQLRKEPRAKIRGGLGFALTVKWMNESFQPMMMCYRCLILAPVLMSFS